MTVGQRLNKARKKAKLSGEKLGKLVGVSKGQISNIENGTSQLTKANAIVMAEALGVTADWLLNGGEEIPFEQNLGTVTTFKESEKPSNKYGKISVNSEHSKSDTIPEGRLTAHQLEAYTLLPFIPVSARASFVDKFPDMDYEEMGTFPVYNLDPTLKKKGAVVIEVNGDSMEPQLRHRSKVLGVPVDAGDFDYMTGVYAIVYGQQFTIKRIIENTLSREGGEIILKADNGGATVAVPGRAILKAWKIVRMVDAEIS